MSRYLQALQVSMGLAGERLDQRGTRGVNALLGVALGFALLALGLAWLAGYQGGFSWLNPLAGAMLPDWLWMWITRFGDERVLLLLSVLLARRRPEIFWTMLLAALFAILYARGLKHLVDAVRPPGVLPLDQIALIGPALTKHSFPSGHTVSAFVFAGVLFAFTRSGTVRSLLILAACLVGLSRVALGVHWPQDVLAGAFGGLLAAACGVWLGYYWRTGLRARVHLGLLLLPVLCMPLLLIHDGGNPHTPFLMGVLIFVAAAQLLLDYRRYQH